ncbi:MAG: ACT domain-containing protein [Halanaerobiales bacterium]|nr:ACT domain-containing protein [Bacillota bacterium]HOA41105.1 ACT domain-containing protein [Halanaerobiales bacterium]HPZ63392.1 ACT domain-containing protein [Halanaerobiales bacterium]HQD03932.1 ACT domain-containing protein [Halanaerobiales bacterium]
MLIKQISIFLENKSGRLAEVLNILGKNNIDLIAISISDTTDFGILRLIVNKPEEAEKVLQESGCTVNSTEVLAVSVEDKPGSLAEVLAVLARESIDIEYLYAVGKDTRGAVVIVRVNDLDRAIKILTENKIELLSAERLYKL